MDGFRSSNTIKPSFYLANHRWHLFTIGCLANSNLNVCRGGDLCFFGIVFGMLPVVELRRKGRVRKGKSYVHTTKLVDTGIYSIVRHPQFVTFVLWAIAGMLLFQHWIIIILGVPIIPLTYIDLIRADKAAIEKFGDDYKAYIKGVPRANFVLGIIRHLRHRKNR